jgi:hypothetical protein
MTTTASPEKTLSKVNSVPIRLASVVLACLSVLALNSLAAGQQPPVVKSTARQFEFELQTRDPVTGEIIITREKADAEKIGVIAVDVWNFHWCKTATMRVDAFVPRFNKALEAARSLGMTVMLCPSDVVDNYVGFPQRESVLALPLVTVPKVMEVTCPPVPDAGGCACGREKCAGNFGWDGMHPDLKIGKDDWMPDSQAEVYTICRLAEAATADCRLQQGWRFSSAIPSQALSHFGLGDISPDAMSGARPKKSGVSPM